MLACAVMTTTASLGACARNGSIRSSPDSVPSRRSISATSAGRLASAAVAAEAVAASSTAWPLRLQRDAQGPADIRLVVDDQDAHGRSLGPERPRP